MATRVMRRPYTETNNYLKIEGETVKVITESVTRVVKLTDFLNMASTHTGVSTPVLPLGCRIFRQKGARSAFLIERPPQVKQLTWRHMDPDPKKLMWKLAFPYQIFILGFNGSAITEQCSIYYRVAPISSLEDRLLHTNLTNIYENDRICTGSMRAVNGHLLQKAESFITAFWQSEFNTDLVDYHFHKDGRHNKELTTLEAWQTASKDNPLFPLEAKWRESTTVEEALTTTMLERH